MNFGKNVKEIRESKGLSQRELGELIGVKQQTIAQYESLIDAPKSVTVNKIANALGVTFRDLTDTHRSIDYEEFAFIAGLTSTEGKMLNSLNKLNRTGQSKAIEQVELLTKIPEYRKQENNIPKLNAAHARTDITPTPEGQAHDNAIMDDNSEWE